MKSLATALRVLAVFQQGERNRTVGEISKTLDIPKSRVSRILAEFRENGWLTQDPETRAYSIALGAYVVGVRYLSADRLARDALPVLRAAADRSGFTTALSILDGFKPLYLFGVEAPIFADLGTRMGEHFPIHASAPGKVLGAFSPPEVFEHWVGTYGLTPVTSKTICDYAEIKREFKRIRDRGYAVSAGERTPGFNGLAAPVFRDGGTLAAAISLAYPDSHVRSDQLDYYATILHDAARQLSHRMGTTSYPFGQEFARTGQARRGGATELRIG